MRKETYKFKTGSFDCYTLFDGILKYENPIQVLFPSAPKAELREALANRDLDSDNWKEWISDYSCLLVDTGDHKILLDTGMGRFNPFTGNLPKNLRAVGIDPETIDYIILTHAHPDHIGGVVDEKDNLVFPNATHLMSRAEWEFWTNDPAPALEKAGMDEMHRSGLVWFTEKCLPLIQPNIQLLDDESEIVPGIYPVKAHGHTPGHLAVRISSAGETLLYMGDAFINPLHMEYPHWNPSVDIQREKAVESRLMLSELAIRDKAVVSCFHFDFPCLGHVERINNQFQFVSGTR